MIIVNKLTWGGGGFCRNVKRQGADHATLHLHNERYGTIAYVTLRNLYRLNEWRVCAVYLSIRLRWGINLRWLLENCVLNSILFEVVSGDSPSCKTWQESVALQVSGFLMILTPARPICVKSQLSQCFIHREEIMKTLKWISYLYHYHY